MLTENQKANLLKLTDHPKFGKLLIDAIETWNREDILPWKRKYGIEFVNYRFEKIKWHGPSPCCLVGSALLEKDLIHESKRYEISEAMFFALMKFYNINHDEANALIDGFDGVNDSGFKLLYPETFKFANDVARALTNGSLGIPFNE